MCHIAAGEIGSEFVIRRLVVGMEGMAVLAVLLPAGDWLAVEWDLLQGFAADPEWKQELGCLHCHQLWMELAQPGNLCRSELLILA
jgi:hypothetical protein